MISITFNLLDYFTFTSCTCQISGCRINDKNWNDLSRMISPTLITSGSGASTIGTCTFSIDTSVVLNLTNIYLRLDSSIYNYDGGFS